MNLPARFATLFAVSLLLAIGFGNVFGQDEELSDEENAEVTVDTCGKLAGHLVTYTQSTKHETFNRGNERFDADHTIGYDVLTRNEGRVDTAYETLLSWSNFTFGNGVGAPEGPEVKAQKNSLKLFYASKILAEFEYKKNKLSMTPEFRKKVIRNLEKDTSEIYWGMLLEILEGAHWPDKHIVQVLHLHDIRDSIRYGHVDAMLGSLQTMSGDPADDTIARYCKRLSDSLAAANKANQPLKLESPKKVGSIMEDPIYPPLDSPTIFWKGALLAVVQEEAARPRMMRTFDPRSRKWGKKEPVKYPETAMSDLFVKNTGTYSIGCPYETYCWRKKLGEFNDDPCDGLSCGPLIMLKDSTGGSLGETVDLLRAGGSAAAGYGNYEFRESGTLYRMDDTKESWEVLPGPTLSGLRPYEFELNRTYPVVVSPDQKWIAYVVRSKDEKAKDLWVAGLKYKE